MVKQIGGLAHSRGPTKERRHVGFRAMAISTPRPIATLNTYHGWDRCALSWPALSRRLRLSPQQSTILMLIVTEDLTTEAIALRLAVTPAAIRTQLDRLRSKLGVHSRAAIVATAWRAWMGMERERSK